MGLQGIVQRAAQTAFKAMGDIPHTCAYVSKGIPIYDPVTGDTVASDAIYENLGFVFEDYSFYEVDGITILTLDQKMMTPQSNLNLIPKIKDVIIAAGDVEWVIESIKQDTASAIWEFQGRRIL